MLAVEGGEVLEGQRLIIESFLKHFDISIGTSHAGSLIINDVASRAPSHQKLLHNACTNPQALRVDSHAAQEG